MAKRKKRKNDKKNKFEFSFQLYGIILIILSIMAFGAGKPLGWIGKLMRCFAIFLFGTLDWLFLICLFCLGIYILFKGKAPSLWSTKFIGILIVTVGILVFGHLNYVLENDGKAAMIYEVTIDDTMRTFESIKSELPFTTYGSGIVGCSLAVLFNILFDHTGTKIVSIILMITGFCFFTGFSIVDFIKNGLEKSKNLLPKRKEKDNNEDNDESVVIINDNNNPKINDNVGPKINDNNEIKEEVSEPKLVISSIDELKRMNNEVKEENNIVQEETIETLLGGGNTPSANVNPTNTNYILPTLSLLKDPVQKKKANNQEAIERNIITLEKTLREFGIIGKVVEVNSGPSVTQYELELQSGTKLSKLLSINREISLSLAKKDVRIQAPIPGKSTVGIEIPNESVSPVTLKEILENVPQNKVNNKLLAALGKNIMGKSLFVEIDKTPHLLVAGSTGSGKSVCINCIIASILMRAKPDEVKLVMVDPKKVELSMYNGIPHLLAPVVTDPKKASIALKNIVNEMEKRYDLFERTKCKNIIAYNEMCKKNPDYQRLPYIVVIIDELADLMLVAAKEVEDSILRITQMARAAGIHLIVATQRPSTDVITGVVKANIPSRISFAVSSNIDSRTILDCVGAEKLLGKGDMLFLPMGENIPMRVQGAYVSEEELQKIVDWTISQQKACYDESLTEDRTNTNVAGAYDDAYQSEENYDDPLYNEIVDLAVKTGKISASLVQRKYRLGYNRAARIIDLLEERGIIGPQNGSKPREVLVKLESNNEEGEE